MLWYVRKGQSVTLFDVTDEYGRFAGKVKQYYSSSELTENVVEELKMRVLHAR
ncbi:hypothetical protein HO686_10270, partial [Streptococcus suis]|nr:hypothetical protein [Streptococcus suis]